MATTFVTWTFAGTRYLAVPMDGSYAILDENGRWYGGWLSIESFRRRQQSGDPFAPLPAGATLAVRTHAVEAE